MNGFERNGGTIVYREGNETMWVEPWGADSVRVRATPNRQLRDTPGSLLDAGRREAKVRIGDDGAELINGKLRVEVDATGRLRFLRSEDGRPLLEEVPTRILHSRGRTYLPAAGELHQAESRFLADDDERIYGLGQHRHGKLDQKGCTLDLRQQNCEVTIPFYCSSRGYGFLWHNPGVGRVEFGRDLTRWIAEETGQIDFWVTAGDTPAEIMSHYADATGHAPMLPEWASGFWQCKLRYKRQDELLAVAKAHRERGLPMSVIVIDFFHWTRMGDFEFDAEAWPDPAGLVAELEAMGIKTMVSIWPSFNPDSRNFDEFRDNGLLIRDTMGTHAKFEFFDTDPPGKVYIHHYDATNPEAGRLFWEKVRDSYYRQGFRVFWLDCCEPQFHRPIEDHLLYHAGTGREVACIYPFMQEKTFHEGMTAEGQTNVINLCRSAWAGSQRFGAAVWSGDIESTFESLQAQVRAGQNIAMSGIPWWTTDIGGFMKGDPTTDYFRELIVRWFQFGVFCPLFRLHGHREPAEDKGGGPNEVWTFGETAYPIITELLHLRERLRPYIMAQMQAAADHGTPVMRPLYFDFPEDPAAAEVDDQFMFGPDLLIAPVVEEGATQRAVYLPAGTSWRDAWTDERHDGGRTITRAAPLETIPVYLKGDAALPIRGV